MLHVVAPLGIDHIPQPSTNQYKDRIAIGESTYYPGAAADFSVEIFNNIVGIDTCLVFPGKTEVGKHLFNTVFYRPGSLFQLHGTQHLHHDFAFPQTVFLLS